VDEEECIACGACADRCHMDAITVEQTASVNPDRCIGCGVCVTDCPTGAMLYKQKEKSDQYVPPVKTFEAYMNMAVERGKN
jgi:ferredoxin